VPIVAESWARGWTTGAAPEPMKTAREEGLEAELAIARDQHDLTMRTVGDHILDLKRGRDKTAERLDDAREEVKDARRRIERLEEMIIRWHQVDREPRPTAEAQARRERARVALGVSCGR